MDKKLIEALKTLNGYCKEYEKKDCFNCPVDEYCGATFFEWKIDESEVEG